MKKIILTTALTFLAACTTYTKTGSTVATSASFIGDWECRMDGGVATSNKVSLSKDGKAAYLGKMVVPSDNPVFQYDIKRTGTWTYVNHVLTYKFGKGTVTRAHADEVQQALQTDGDLVKAENEYYTALTKQMTKAAQTTINLTVSNFAQDSFTIQQNIGETARTGLCVRPR